MVTVGAGLVGAGYLASGSSQYDNYITSPGYHDGILGQVRYDGSQRNLQVFDGSGWQTLIQQTQGQNLSISIDATYLSVLNWALSKMEEENKLKEIVKADPTLAKQIEQLTTDRDSAFSAISNLYQTKADALFRKATVINKMNQE
jgi:hypothetical protein